MGLADKLGIGRSATFIATVNVHELTQVPLVSAKLKLKWKFHDATSGHGLEPALDGDESTGSGPSSSSGARRFLHPRAALNSNGSGPAAASGSRSRSPAESPSRDSYEDYSRNQLPSPPQSPPMSPVDPRTPNPNRTPSASHSSTFAFTSPFSPNETIHSPQSSFPFATNQSSPNDDSPQSQRGRRRGGGDLTYMPPLPVQIRAEPKGATSLINLRSHTAVFNREIHCPIMIHLRSIGNGRYQLTESQLKLSVRQELPGDNGKSVETKLGEVVLDLSQFAGQGRREAGSARRYLLKESKTNATFRITVKMEWVAGEHDFVPSPFRTGLAVNAYGSSTNSANASSTSLNRSSASSISSKKAALGNGRVSASSSSMIRVGSSSSLSTQSGPSVRGSITTNGHPHSNGWHPTSRHYAANAPSPGLLGSPEASERSAADIIESIFNRPQRQSSWSSHLPVAHPPPRHSKSSDALAGQAGRSRTFGLAAPANIVTSFSTNGKAKGKEPAAPRLTRSTTSQPPSYAPPPRPSSSASSRPLPPPVSFTSPGGTSTPSSSASASTNPSPSRPHGASRRRPSISAQSVASSKNLSVRWGDEPPPPPSSNTTPTSTTTNSSASASMRDSSLSEESMSEDERPIRRNGTPLAAAPGGGVGLARAISSASAASKRSAQTTSSSKSKKPLVPTAVGGSGGIEWGKSW